jgi:hypothetical protein
MIIMQALDEIRYRLKRLEELEKWLQEAANPDCRQCDGTGAFYGNVHICTCIRQLANCCVCGRIIDTREKSEGGDDFGAQTDDGLWTCDIDCWEDHIAALVKEREAREQEFE